MAFRFPFVSMASQLTSSDRWAIQVATDTDETKIKYLSSCVRVSVCVCVRNKEILNILMCVSCINCDRQERSGTMWGHESRRRCWRHGRGFNGKEGCCKTAEEGLNSSTFTFLRIGTNVFSLFPFTLRHHESHRCVFIKFAAFTDTYRISIFFTY